MRGIVRHWAITMTIVLGVPLALVWIFMPILDISHADYLTSQNDYEGALRSLNRAIAFNGLISSAYDRRGCILGKLKVSDKAFADFDKALSLNDSDWQIYNNRAWFIASLPNGDLNAAIKDAEKATSICISCAPAFDTRGFIEYKMGNLLKAQNDFDRALELNPRLGEAYYHRSLCFQALNNSKRALIDRRDARRMGYFDDEEGIESGSI